MVDEKKILAEIEDLKKNFDKRYEEQEKKWEKFRNASRNQEAFLQADCNIKLAEELYRARKEAHLTQTQLAEKMHTTQSQLARLEQNANNSKFSTVLSYLEACGKTLAVIDKKHA